jgi:hypothetical protein
MGSRETGLRSLSEATMSFSVNTKALVGLPQALDRRASDLDIAYRYVTANTMISTFGVADMRGVHQHVVAAISAYLGALNTVYADPDAIRIRAVIAAYTASDLRAAQRADAAIVGLPSGLPVTPPITAAGRSYGPAIFDDRRAPTGTLIAPADPYAEFPYQPSWSDALSPSSVARDTIWKVTGMLAEAGLIDRPIDPLEEIVRPFVGDWAGLLRSADVFTHLGAMLPAASSCVTDEAELIPTIWTGNVAGMCVANLNAFAASLADGFSPLADLATRYRQVATGVRDNATIMETVVTNLIDSATDLALANIAGLSEVWGASAQIRGIVRTIELAIRIVNNVLDLIAYWKDGAGTLAAHFGVLSGVGAAPTIIDPAPPILMPAR